jgi:hypothetical protein
LKKSMTRRVMNPRTTLHGCSHFYRQTAKVRFPRTTSKIQHQMETTAAADERKQTTIWLSPAL